MKKCNTLPLMPWALRQADFTARSLDLKQPQPQLHTDIARLKQGKVGAQVSLFHSSMTNILSHVIKNAVLERLGPGIAGRLPRGRSDHGANQPRLAAAAAVRRPSPNHFTTPLSCIGYPPAHSYPDTFKVCLSAADVEAAVASRPPKIASLIGMEGGHSIGGSIDTLTSMYSIHPTFDQSFETAPPLVFYLQPGTKPARDT